MEHGSLHPFDIEQVRRYVQAVTAEVAPLESSVPSGWLPLLGQARCGFLAAAAGRLSGLNEVSYGLALALATIEPSFAAPGLGLTIWEARVDRGIGMRMRPPSRLFIDAGFDTRLARAMPIRLDLSGEMMGGAYVPARLVPDLETFLRDKMARLLRRLNEAEFDGPAVLGLMIEACAYAGERTLGLYEAMDVIVSDEPAALPPGSRVITADRQRLDPELRRALAEAERADKPPSLIGRVLKRHARRIGPNGRTPGP